MFHLVDAWAVFAITWVGGKHVFIPYFNAEALLPLFEAEAVSHTALVPTMVNALLNSGVVWQYSYRALSTIMTAGSPIAPEIVKQIQEVFSCTYVQFYGMTETSPFLSISLPKSKDLLRSKAEILAIRSKTGRPFIGVDLKVVKEDGSEVQRDGLDVGEIIARGPNVTKGYWKNLEATAQTIRGGWIYTGDLAVMDSDGYINVVDRSKI
jgi:fatty-acyl-CoA synthase